MYFTLKTVPNQNKYLLTTTQHPTSQPHTPGNNTPRTQTKLNTLNYDRSRRRAFARAKLLAYFNPDLTQFITLTYKDNQLSEQQTLHHLKQFLKYQKNSPNKQTSSLEITGLAAPRDIAYAWQEQGVTVDDNLGTAEQKHKHQTTNNQQPLRPKGPSLSSSAGTTSKNEGQGDQRKPFKYIYVFERQQRGAIHVHMIANECFQTFTNKNGHQSLKYWNHGFTSVLNIKQADKSFKPYLYLFKYMAKSQRIGSSFIHTSRSFDKIVNVDYADYINTLREGKILFKEDYNL